MRPFFSYYGAKYTGARYLGPPKHKLVIEPFAGSACFSTRWNVRDAWLYDTSEDICLLWDFLINSSTDDISAIPDYFDCNDQFNSLANGPRLLCSFWVSKGRAEPSNVLSPWYHQYKNSSDCRVWGPAVKRRIIQQKPLIERWRIERLCWSEIPDVEAHWHVDPPYNNSAGRRYPKHDIDYSKLATWCRGRTGHVDVCENVGADWLPFESLYEVVSSRGRRDGSRSKEAVWQK